MTIRIVCISDTHLERPAVPDGDILVHAGDATLRGTKPEIEEFAEWFESLPHKEKVFVPGNHDIAFEYFWEGACRLLPTVRCLNDMERTIHGLKFWGSPWQPEFYSWAFNLPRGAPLKAHWDMVPEDTDVLVTHSPPMGWHDRVWRVAAVPDSPKMRRYREHVGCADMRHMIGRVQPRLHVFGHIHSDAGQTRHIWKENRRPSSSNGCTRFVNAAVCDERYRPVQPPVVIDL